MIQDVFKTLVLMVAALGAYGSSHASIASKDLVSRPAVAGSGFSAGKKASKKIDKIVEIDVAEDQPNIVISGKQISYNGFQIAIGDDFDLWKKAIGGRPQCTTSKDSAIFCIWDKLGIELASDNRRRKARFFILTINAAPPDPYDGLMTKRPDGSPYLPAPVLSPKSNFPGKLVLDGFRITSETTFREFQRQADQSRNFRCGFKCLEPTSMLNETVLMYFHLVDYGENNRIETIAIE